MKWREGPVKWRDVRYGRKADFPRPRPMSTFGVKRTAQSANDPPLYF